MKICGYIDALVRYGMECGLIRREDEIFARNSILSVLQIDDYTPCETVIKAELEDILRARFFPPAVIVLKREYRLEQIASKV